MSHSPFVSRRSRRVLSSGIAGLAVAALAAMVPALLPEKVSAQDATGDPIARRPAADEGWSVKGGLGFTANPDTFLMNLEAQRTIGDWLAIGPMLQLGFDDHWTFAAPTLDATVRPFHFSGEGWERIVPYAFVGAGVGILHDDDARGDDTSAGLLIDVGGGIEFRVTEHVYLVTQMMFDFLPEQTQGQKFVYAWQVGGLRYAF